MPAAGKSVDDSYTTGAVCGQIEGAFYGASSVIGERWKKLALLAEIEKLGAGLCKMTEE